MNNTFLINNEYLDGQQKYIKMSIIWNIHSALTITGLKLSIYVVLSRELGFLLSQWGSRTARKTEDQRTTSIANFTWKDKNASHKITPYHSLCLLIKVAQMSLIQISTNNRFHLVPYNLHLGPFQNIHVGLYLRWVRKLPLAWPEPSQPGVGQVGPSVLKAFQEKGVPFSMPSFWRRAASGHPYALRWVAYFPLIWPRLSQPGTGHLREIHIFKKRQ